MIDNLKNKNKKEIIELVKKDINVLSKKDVKKHDDYEEIMKEVITTIHPFALLIASEEIKSNKDIVIQMLKKFRYPVLLKFVSPKLLKDPKFFLELILEIYIDENKSKISTVKDKDSIETLTGKDSIEDIEQPVTQIDTEEGENVSKVESTAEKDSNKNLKDLTEEKYNLNTSNDPKKSKNNNNNNNVIKISFLITLILIICVILYLKIKIKIKKSKKKSKRKI